MSYQFNILFDESAHDPAAALAADEAAESGDGLPAVPATVTVGPPSGSAVGAGEGLVSPTALPASQSRLVHDEHEQRSTRDGGCGLSVGGGGKRRAPIPAHGSYQGQDLPVTRRGADAGIPVLCWGI